MTQPYSMSLLLFRSGTDAHSCKVHILDSGSYLWPVYSWNFCYQELVRSRQVEGSHQAWFSEH